MMVYEISHTLGNQSEYVAANSPAEAIEKLKETYISDGFPNGRINDKDIISIVNLGDLILKKKRKRNTLGENVQKNSKGRRNPKKD